MTKKIPLPNGIFVIVDDEDYDFLMQWKWHVRSGGYVIREHHLGFVKGIRKRKRIYMHRVINNTPDSLETDHINGDKLDNRRINLRNATRHQSIINRGSVSGSSSKYKGVCWRKDHHKWRAKIRINKKDINLGSFTSEIDAARAYDRAAIKYHGEYARLNAA